MTMTTDEERALKDYLADENRAVQDDFLTVYKDSRICIPDAPVSEVLDTVFAEFAAAVSAGEVDSEDLVWLREHVIYPEGPHGLWSWRVSP